MNRGVSTQLDGPQSALRNQTDHLTGCWCISNQGKVHGICSRFRTFLHYSFVVHSAVFTLFKNIFVFYYTVPTQQTYTNSYMRHTYIGDFSSHSFLSGHKEGRDLAFIDHLICILPPTRIFPYMISFNALSNLAKRL